MGRKDDRSRSAGGGRLLLSSCRSQQRSCSRCGACSSQVRRRSCWRVRRQRRSAQRFARLHVPVHLRFKRRR